MAFTVFPDGAKAVISHSWNGVPVSTVLHFSKASPVVADYIALALAVATEWAVDILVELSNDMVMGDVTVYDLSAEFAPKYVDSSKSGTAGGNVGDSWPNNTALIVSHRTNATGRSGRGRTYVPAISEIDESNGLLTTVKQTAMVTAWGDFITAVEVGGWLFVVAQRFLNKVQLVTGVMRDVTTEILKRELGTQRRRQVRSAV